MNKSILIIVNGFGMGNATRCDALIDVVKEDYRVEVVASDRAFEYFKINSKVARLYKQDDLNLDKIYEYGSFAYYRNYIPHFLKRLFRNYSIQKKIMGANSFNYIVFDSDYGFILHRLFGGKKNLITLNNSYEIVAYFFTHVRRLRFELWASMIIEGLDLLAHLVFSRFVICPCLNYNAEKPQAIFKKILLSPVLVRAELVEADPKNNLHPNVVVIPSSSNVRSFTGPAFLLDNVRQLADSTLIVCNSGQSTLAECLFLNRTAVVTPIPRHAEQWVNSQIVYQKGMLKFDETTSLEDLARKKLSPDYAYCYPETVKKIREHLTTINGAVNDHLRG